MERIAEANACAFQTTLFSRGYSELPTSDLVLHLVCVEQETRDIDVFWDYRRPIKLSCQAALDQVEIFQKV